MKSSKELEDKENIISEKNIQLLEMEQQVEKLQVRFQKLPFFFEKLIYFATGWADYDSFEVQGGIDEHCSETGDLKKWVELFQVEWNSLLYWSKTSCSWEVIMTLGLFIWPARGIGTSLNFSSLPTHFFCC